jgi:hypothetical protein
MKHLTPKLIVLAFTGLVMLASCEYEHPLIPTEPEDTTTNPQADTISFSQDIIPFLNDNCVRCHKGSTDPDLRDNKAYSALMNGNYVDTAQPENSPIYQKCKTGSMAVWTPVSGLKLLKRWIAAGAKND